MKLDKVRHFLKDHIPEAVGPLHPNPSDFGTHSLFNTLGHLLKYLKFSEEFDLLHI